MTKLGALALALFMLGNKASARAGADAEKEALQKRLQELQAKLNAAQEAARVKAAEDAKKAEAARLKAEEDARKAEAAKEAAKKETERAIGEYETARGEYLKADHAYREAPTDASFRALQAAGRVFEDKALAAYVRDRSKRTIIREQLSATLPKDHKAVIDYLEEQLRATGGDPQKVVELFEDANDKSELARTMSDPQNQQKIQRILEEADRQFPEPPKDPKAGPSVAPRKIPARFNFNNAFELLRGLNTKALRFVSEEVKRQIGRYDPEVRFVRERLAIVYLSRDGATSPIAKGFKQAFTGWMRDASPDHAVKALEFVGWVQKDIDELMNQATQILTMLKNERSRREKQPDEKPLQLPKCPATTPSRRADEIDAVLCAPAYAGVIAVEIDGPRARAWWRVLEEGTTVNTQHGFEGEGVVVSGSGDEPAGRLLGDRFALSVLIDGTIYKRLGGIFTKVRQRPEPKRDNEQQPPRMPGQPVAVVDGKQSPGTGDKPVIVTPPAPEKLGTPLHALLFAATPYLEDPHATGLSRGIFAGADLAVAATAITFLGLSIDRRNDYSDTGDVRALDAANDFRRAAIYTAAGMLAFRGAIALCYWRKSCREWTRSW